MSCERYHQLMMASLDGEIAEGDKGELEEHVRGCSDCAREMEGFRRLTTRMHDLKLVEPSDREWERFWSTLYNRLERKVAWGLLVLGMSLTVGFLCLEFFQAEMPLVLKVGVSLMTVGGALLFLSVLRGRLRIMKVDRYREIER